MRPPPSSLLPCIPHRHSFEIANVVDASVADDDSVANDHGDADADENGDDGEATDGVRW